MYFAVKRIGLRIISTIVFSRDESVAVTLLLVSNSSSATDSSVISRHLPVEWANGNIDTTTAVLFIRPFVCTADGAPLTTDGCDTMLLSLSIYVSLASANCITEALDAFVVSLDGHSRSHSHRVSRIGIAREREPLVSFRSTRRIVFFFFLVLSEEVSPRVFTGNT